MDALVTFFPVLLIAVSIGLIVAVIRLDRRLSRGAQSAGPIETTRPKPVGLRRTPWELQALDDQVRSRDYHRSRTDLINTINRLVKAGGVDDPGRLLGPDATDADIDGVIRMLEQRLELPPLVPTDAPYPLGSPHR